MCAFYILADGMNLIKSVDNFIHCMLMVSGLVVTVTSVFV